MDVYLLSNIPGFVIALPRPLPHHVLTPNRISTFREFLATIKRLPPYAENRYSSEQPGRMDTGHIVMGAQYIAGEVMREITGYSIRSAQTPPDERGYPIC